MTPQEKWGLPDWTKSDEYPAEATDRLWRWEFLRRRPAYREAWEQWEGFFQRKEESGAVYAVTDEPIVMELNFGVSVIYDPRQRFDAWTAGQIFRDAEGGLRTVLSSARHLKRGAYLAEIDASEDGPHNALQCEIDWQLEMEEVLKDAGLMDYRFNIRRPLKPQIEKAAMQLRAVQEELHRRENTPKPSRELWPTYLRVLDARDCDASW
jgi:hypothetical protein